MSFFLLSLLLLLLLLFIHILNVIPQIVSFRSMKVAEMQGHLRVCVPSSLKKTLQLYTFLN